MTPRLGFLLVWLLVAPAAAAQAVGTCPRALGEAYLDVGNVRARLLNTGGLFYRGEPHVYEVPKGSGIHAIFAAGIWVAGRVQGKVRAAASRYGEWEFWGGPLDDRGHPPADCAAYDRLYSIYRTDVEIYNATGVATTDLRVWPWQLGAPVVDGDGDPANYNLVGGDRPALWGDQTVWWVMNDRGNVHQTTDAPPIGLEVRATAWAFAKPGSPPGNATFYRFVLHYRGAESLEDAYVGFWTDPDLGAWSDDYVGSDTLLHLAYAYNADNHDGDFLAGEGYGTPAPAVGYAFLRTATDPDGRDGDFDGQVDEPGEPQGMTSFLFYNGGGGVTEDPESAQDYYFYMQGRWKDGQSLTYGANGRDFSDTPTHFMFSGDPVTGEGWSERNPAGDGSLPPIDPADRRGVMATGPFTLDPGETQEIVVAVAWSRGSDHLDSVRQLKAEVANLHRFADVFLEPVAVPPPPAPPSNPVLGFAPNVPNPFRGATTIRYSLPGEASVRLAVYDVLGREIARLVDERQAGGVHTVAVDASGWAPGVYVARLQVGAFRFTRTMLHTR